MKATTTKKATRNGVPLALLGARIRRARRAAKLSHERLGLMVGCSRIHLMRLEKGLHEPADELLARIAEATDQPLSFFTKKPVKRARVGEVELPPEAQEAFVEAATSLLAALMQAVTQAKSVEYEEVDV